MEQPDASKGTVCLELSLAEMQHLMELSAYILDSLPKMPLSEQRDAWEDLCYDIWEEGERIFAEIDSQPQDADQMHLGAIPAPPHARHRLANHSLGDLAK